LKRYPPQWRVSRFATARTQRPRAEIRAQRDRNIIAKEPTAVLKALAA
jgi:hypothetical protein